jgi:hypothetical protein
MVAQPRGVRLLPITVAPSMAAAAGGGVPIVVSVSGVEVRVDVGTEVAYVADLVGALRARC